MNTINKFHLLDKVNVINNIEPKMYITGIHLQWDGDIRYDCKYVNNNLFAGTFYEKNLMKV